jgi:ariadne-1
VEDEVNDADDDALIIEQLEESRRVRTKLATSEDAALPRILSLLLPRLLRKMDDNRDEIIRSSGMGGNSSFSCTAVQTRAILHEEYLGIINHAIDRIEIFRDGMNAMPIVKSMATFVTEMASKSVDVDGRSFITPGLSHALRLLRLCLSRSANQFCVGSDNSKMPPENLDTLMGVLKASIATVERMDYDNKDQVISDANRNDYAFAGWLVLDSISLLVGILPLSLDLRLENVGIQTNEQKYTSIVAAIAPIVGTATYNLFLDLVLYQPIGSNSCGFSPRGIRRMQMLASLRGSIEPTTDVISRWNELKLVVLKLAAGTVKGGGVFGWKGDVDKVSNMEDTCVLQDNVLSNGTARAITLLVLAASEQGLPRETNARKIAAFTKATLQTYIPTGEDDVPTKKKARGRRSHLSRSIAMENDDSDIVCAASMLLCLALGGVESSTSIMGRCEEQWNECSSIMGMIHATNDFRRSPLSQSKIRIVFSFVLEQFGKASIEPVSPKSLGEEKAVLITLAVHATQLALRLNEENDATRRRKRMQIGWGDGNGVPTCASQLLLVLGKWLNACIEKGSAPIFEMDAKRSSFVEQTCRQIFDIAYEILRSDVLPLLNDGIARGLAFGGDDDQMEDVPVAYRHRGRLARERRVAQSRQQTLVPPLQIRQSCIDIIRVMMRYSAQREGFLDVPVLLFNCLKMDAELAPQIAVVLEELLEVYIPFATKYRASIEGCYLVEDRLIQSVTPLLPLLLTASTSNTAARRLAMKWSAEFVQVLDKKAARVLSVRLSRDTDKMVATQAKKVVGAIKTEVDDKDVTSSVMFFDSEEDIGMGIVLTKLDQDIEALAQKLKISKDGAAVMMQNSQYSVDRALVSIQTSDDLERTLDSIGVLHRCRLLLNREVSTDEATSCSFCNICFDEIMSQDDGYSLLCRHTFCRECFSTYLSVKMEDRCVLNCPQHGCNEHIVEEDVIELLPSMLNVWKKIQFRHFVMKSHYTTFCPGNDCTMVAFSDMKTCDAQCTKCDTSFCFGCGEKPHTPATCSDAEKFMPLFDTSDYCVMKFSKRCPGPNCNVPIQKNDGCNHMTCRECNAHFCWVCLSLINGYGDLETHACNKFDPRDTFDTKEKDEFFLSRYEASAEGETYAKKGLDALMKKMADAERDDVRALVRASKCLIRCRQFLKNTFILAWAWHRDVHNDNTDADETSATRKEIFEAHQATLTSFTENLQQLVEKEAFTVDLDTLDFYTCALTLYLERMMEFISRCRETA